MLRSITRKAAVAFLIALLSSVTSYGYERCTSCQVGASNFDSASGLCLPSSIEGFESIVFPEARLSVLKAYRNSVVAGFNVASHRLAITVYLYDREESEDAADTNEMRTAVAEILAAHRGSRLTDGGKTSLALGGTETDAQGGLFLWREGVDDYASFLWLVPHGRRYLKLRATYVRPNGGERDAMKFAKDSATKLAAAICRAR